MKDILRFDPDGYILESCAMNGITLTYRSYKKITYCMNPLDPIQNLNLFVNEELCQGKNINGYIYNTAPIFIPNTVGGYMPGSADEPGKDFLGRENAIFHALKHGYVVVSPGVRGRTSGMKSNEFFVGSKEGVLENEDGLMVGRAPAFVVDMKAVIRYLRYNKEQIPGNTEHIITSGTSAGGALSALTGTSGNQMDYEPYLKKIGAAEGSDQIYAANCYCPIHNLENSDTAYEWLFYGHHDFYRIKHQRSEQGIKNIRIEGTLTEKQKQVSKDLKELFPAYVNQLKLIDEEGNSLYLDQNGEGTFKEYIKEQLKLSAQKELDDLGKYGDLYVEGSEISKQEYLKIKEGKVISLDWEQFVAKISRMKAVPSFDAFDLNSPENEEFGNETIKARHFTEYSFKNSEMKGLMAEEIIIKMMNPLSYVESSDCAKFWRIRHGAFDRDTSLAIPVILALKLMQNGKKVDFCLPWGLPHSGDYDFEELFQWIDKICH